MKDPKWQEILAGIRPHLRANDVVLAPRGDWPKLPCQVRLYDDLIQVIHATILVLHKGYLPSIDKARLRQIVENWRCICANDVFVCFAKGPRAGADIRLTSGKADFAPLQRYLDSRNYRQRKSTLWYIHLPKTGGTSIWRSLQRQHTSHVYFSNAPMFAAHPPDPSEYDLIGGHLPLAIIRDFIGPDDHVVGMIRHPTERLLSALLHCRRPSADGAAFWGAMAEMRRSRFADFLKGNFAPIETQLQLFMLGHDARNHALFNPAEALMQATVALADPRYVFGPSELAERFVRRNAKILGIKPKMLGHHNANNYADMTSHVLEFDSLRPEVERINRDERMLYQSILRRFAP